MFFRVTTHFFVRITAHIFARIATQLEHQLAQKMCRGRNITRALTCTKLCTNPPTTTHMITCQNLRYLLSFTMCMHICLQMIFYSLSHLPIMCYSSQCTSDRLHWHRDIVNHAIINLSLFRCARAVASDGCSAHCKRS